MARPQVTWVFFAETCGILVDSVWSTGWSKRRGHVRRFLHHRKRTEPKAKLSCPCVSFRLSDLRWRAFDAAEKKKWDAAVKRKPMSGYELFMKESMSLLNRGHNYPACPSVSGGFSCNYLIGGSDMPEEFIGEAPPPPARWTCTGEPDWQCIPAEDGEYETKQECLDDCFSRPTPWPEGDTCQYCIRLTPSKITCELRHLTGAAAVWNDTYILPQTADCLWEILGPPIHLYHSRPPPAWDVVTLIHAATGDLCTWKLDPRPPDCYGERTLPWLNGTGWFADEPHSIAVISGNEPIF